MSAFPDGDTIRVTGHAEALAVVQDPETFSSKVSRFLQVPNGLDGEEHAAFRRALDPYFNEERMAALEGPVREVARRAVAAVPKGEPVEVIHGLGVQFAVDAMLAWLGWSPDLRQELIDWVAENASASRSGDLERTTEVAQWFDDIIGRVVDPRAAHFSEPSQDVTDELIRQEVDGRQLARPEIISILRNWTGGDLGSLALCAGVVLHQLAEDPAIEAEVRSRRTDPSALAAAIDELLRIDDPFVSNRRVATRETKVGGCPVAHGQRLVVDWTLANRDPARFPDPDRYEPEANAGANLVYGAGPHVCPGRPLATLELRILLEEVLDATRDLSLPPDQPGVRAERPLGGWSQKPVVFA
ncbi:cytochrome P450 [Tessaracoccus sp. ZS01]|uniref:cytochrome P450 n=1 Tax=Tessaracoccus sp. ZS01 TaxID=1906324 RepID=UPI00096DA05D|nr:cytochrome P450 [Tessaracoccus sp. ZS01]MCG6568670.1 cytochrome P450 [Tessaracoccus sp. ZS01]OMG51996.1 cytochrome [Tessaracoccus sp. ZS01]